MKSYDDWIKSPNIFAFNASDNRQDYSRLDFNAVNYLSSITVGYMTSPAVKLPDESVLVAQNTNTSDLRSFKEYYSTADKKIYVYMVIWVPSSPMYDESGEPKIVNGLWKIRFANKE